MATGYIETLKGSGISEGGISYYCMTKSDVTSGYYFPQISAVMNAFFNPYLKYGNMSTVVESVKESIQTSGNSNGTGWTGSVKRITSYNTLSETIISFNDYDKSGLTIGGNWNWKNESKCHCAPFTTLSYEDGLSEPLTIYPQYCKDGVNTISVRSALNQLGHYLLYVNGYRGDTTGLRYGVISQSPPIPTVTNAYSDYMTYQREKVNSERLINGANVLVGLGLSIATGNSLPMISNTGNAMNIFQSFLNERTLKGQGNTVNATNSIYSFILQQNIYGRMYKYQYPPDVMDRIGLFFHQYGYKQGKLMDVNINSRKYFNFIKTDQVNLKSTNVPKQHVKKLQSIFNQGVTIWHVENGSMFNYTKDNVEV